MRLAFMGTPAFAVPVLDAVLKAGHEVRAVYTQPPRPAGRGKAVQKSPVHLAAELHGLAVHTPQSMRDPAEIARFEALSLDAAVVVAYGQILVQRVLDA
ncbi:MAG TPA: methionyl-tRNA formyltransferase, partial [Alphaproteobacteria bacterium]|nr:methionyl-tRNA formyltransferase [Alphaproteobacteria bacterium]